MDVGFLRLTFQNFFRACSADGTFGMGTLPQIWHAWRHRR
jgi:hypothetical protein